MELGKVLELAAVAVPIYSWEQAGHDLYQILPISILTLTILVGIVVDLVTPRGYRSAAVAGVSLLGYLLAGIFAALHWWLGPSASAYHGFISGDRFANFFEVFFSVLGILTVVISEPYLRRRRLLGPEFHILIVAATVGMMALAAATSLVTVFLSLETFSVALYILCGWARRDPRSQESSAKYLLVGSVGSAFLVYGMALTYGATGELQLVQIVHSVAAMHGPFSNPLLSIGIALMAIGFGYKISGAPFHQWTPDVYQGAPLPVTTFMSVGTKAAAFAMILTVFNDALGGAAEEWRAILAFVAVCSMVIGNVAALAQQSVKRLLAYSGVAQAGYVLVGLVGTGPQQFSSVLFYLSAYLFMNFGAFAVLTMLSGTEMDVDRFSDLDGLGRRHPLLGLMMTIFMLSLGGFPPFVGFFGKLFLFQAAIQGGFTWLVVIAVLASVVSVVYYLRVVLHVWSPAVGRRDMPAPRLALGTVVVSGVLSVALGVYPSLLLAAAIYSAGAGLFAGR
ncbi:MAG: NADH-quinone oxidoreductase subunit N [Candidatus Dormibacteraeota bacterium]|nr:NADH-quinone oxidoreductase subunit N [Candidatus Dormibacteraeota bacterium]